MDQYFVHANLHHDGKAYSRGDEVSLDEKTAAPLLSAGVVSTEKPAAPAAVPTNARIQTPEEKAALLKKEAVKVGGAPTESGAPSIDATANEPKRTDAEDVSPKIDYGNMNREKINALAIQEGIDPAKVSEAKTKKDVANLVTAARAEKAATAETPVPPAPGGQQPAAPAAGVEAAADNL